MAIVIRSIGELMINVGVAALLALKYGYAEGLAIGVALLYLQNICLLLTLRNESK